MTVTWVYPGPSGAGAAGFFRATAEEVQRARDATATNAQSTATTAMGCTFKLIILCDNSQIYIDGLQCASDGMPKSHTWAADTVVCTTRPCE